MGRPRRGAPTWASLTITMPTPHPFSDTHYYILAYAINPQRGCFPFLAPGCDGVHPAFLGSTNAPHPRPPPISLLCRRHSSEIGGGFLITHPQPHESSAGALEHRGARNKNHPLQGFLGRCGIANPANEHSWDCKSQRPVTIFRCPIEKLPFSHAR